MRAAVEIHAGEPETLNLAKVAFSHRRSKSFHLCIEEAFDIIGILRKGVDS